MIRMSLRLFSQATLSFFGILHVCSACCPSIATSSGIFQSGATTIICNRRCNQKRGQRCQSLPRGSKPPMACSGVHTFPSCCLPFISVGNACFDVCVCVQGGGAAVIRCAQ